MRAPLGSALSAGWLRRVQRRIDWRSHCCIGARTVAIQISIAKETFTDKTALSTASVIRHDCQRSQLRLFHFPSMYIGIMVVETI